MNSKRRAFALLETMTALGVFCFAGLGLLLALHTTADVASETQKGKRIRGQLENRLAGLSRPPLREHTVTVVDNGVSYTEKVQKADVRSQDHVALGGYWKVEVLAQWDEGKKRQSWSASHLTWSP